MGGKRKKLEKNRAGKNVRTKVSRKVGKIVQGKGLGEKFGKVGKKLEGISWRQKFLFFVSQKLLPTSFKIFFPIIIGTNGRTFTPALKYCPSHGPKFPDFGRLSGR
jgi:hypothetical protein